MLVRPNEQRQWVLFVGLEIYVALLPSVLLNQTSRKSSDSHTFTYRHKSSELNGRLGESIGRHSSVFNESIPLILLYPTSRYIPAIHGMVCFNVIGLAQTLILLYVYRMINKKREAICAKGVNYSHEELRAMGDKAPTFR